MVTDLLLGLLVIVGGGLGSMAILLNPGQLKHENRVLKRQLGVYREMTSSVGHQALSAKDVDPVAAAIWDTVESTIGRDNLAEFGLSGSGPDPIERGKLS